jgi:hypothetical protein
MAHLDTLLLVLIIAPVVTLGKGPSVTRADIATIIGLLDVHRRHPPAQRARHDIETMLERAVSDLASP